VARLKIIVAREHPPSSGRTAWRIRSVVASGFAAVLLIAAALTFLTIGYLVVGVLFVAAMIAVIVATVRGLLRVGRR